MSAEKSQKQVETYNFQGQELPFKTLGVPQSALELLAYYAQNAKNRELEMMFWNSQQSMVRQDILTDLGLDPDTIYVEWDTLLMEGKLKYVQFPKEKKVEDDGQSKV